ncbi:hypothetical protein AB0L75_27965 [Streptomyces sp. NPDC052101]|uniref:hypothetical protein n=1 Tax=Streptomyces sp. NPDC052101 TaxID=3155763 RepID=UPI003412B2DC
MKTCDSFGRIKAAYERDITYLHNHAQLQAGTRSGKVSAATVPGVKRRMARALSKHYEHCRMCG